MGQIGLLQAWAYHKVLGRQRHIVPDGVICIVLPLFDLLKQHSIILVIYRIMNV